MRIFCTGATGFIGSYLVKRLISKGNEVLCLKRPTSDLFRLKDVQEKISWIDMVDGWENKVIDFRPEAIFNLAWAGVSAKNRVLWHVQVGNVVMQQELLDLAKDCGCRKFIGIGSQSEYGDFEEKITESHEECPKTAYAAAKVASLTLLKSFCEIYDIEWYWFRVFPVYGPYESDVWLIPSLIRNICSTDCMDLTPGEQKLPYLYVGECANAIASAINAQGKCGIYNVSADNPRTLKDIVTTIRDMINPRFKLNFGAQPYRYGQSMYMEGDTTKLRENLYKLNTSDYDKHLRETINYYINKYGKI